MTNYYSLQQLASDLESLVKGNPEAKVDFDFTNVYKRIDYISGNDQNVEDADENTFNMIRLKKCDPIFASKLLSTIQDLTKKAESRGPVLVSIEIGGNRWPVVSFANVATVAHVEKFYYESVHNPYHTITKLLEEAKAVTLDDSIKVIEKHFGKKVEITLYRVEGKWFRDTSSLVNAYPCLGSSSNWESAFSKETSGSITVMTGLLTTKELEEVYGSADIRLKALLAEKVKVVDGSGTETTTNSCGDTITKKYGPSHVLLEETIVFSDGTKRVSPYVNGKIEGTAIIYRKGGEVMVTRECKEGKETGAYFRYREDKGGLRVKGHSIDGAPDGIWEDYDQTGALECKYLYVNCKLVDTFKLPLKMTTFRDSLFMVDGTQILVEKMSSGTLILMGVEKDGKVETPTQEDEVRARFRDIKVIKRE